MQTENGVVRTSVFGAEAEATRMYLQRLAKRIIEQEEKEFDK